jgi:heat shock protein HtpX
MRELSEPVRRRHKARNFLQSALLLSGLLGLLALSAFLLTGPDGVLWVLIGGVVGLILAPRLPTPAAMRYFGARRIDQHDILPVAKAVARLASKAGLPTPPTLYDLPDPGMNSFAVGRREDAAIVLTDGMLRRLSLREIVAVLAHEIAHIAHNDLGIMQLADTVSRMTRVMAFVGLAIAVVSIPSTLFGDGRVPWFGMLILIFAPTFSGLLQFALSRTREFEADLEAAALTGDPAGLAIALGKVDRIANARWRRLVLARGDQPSLLRSHPPTVERIERLHSLESDTEPAWGEQQIGQLPTILPHRRRPRIWW